MWCIITEHILDKEIMYLGWQHPVWEDDGYFWTYKDVIKEIIKDNVPEHPFLFESRGEAVKALKALKLPQKCKVIEFEPAEKPAMSIIYRDDVSTRLEKRIIYTIALAGNKFVEVMSLPKENLFYVMQSNDGKMVFSTGRELGNDAYTDDVINEKEIVSFVKSEVKRQAELDALFD